METLERLTRRQIDALRAVALSEGPDRGASLKAISVTLRVRPPSALGHLTALERLGLVERHRGKTRLTSRGRACITDYQRHHRVAEQLFAGLGFSSQETCRAARQIDLALDHRTVERICRAEGHPALCPHGDPIPPCGSANSRP
jgi:DtxR family Mn-dependent transcriptional regulator